MASVGDISVSIFLEMDALRQSIRNVEDDLQRLQDEMQDTDDATEDAAGGMRSALAGIAGALAGGAIAGALKGMVSEILSVTGEVNAMEEQYVQVLGNMKGKADKYIDAMSTKWNKHPSELKNAMMQYTAILKGKGVSEEDAYKLAQDMLERTVDANAFANEDMADTTGRFMGMIKGEYDSLDTAMVNVTATMMQDMAVKKYGKKWEELTVTQQEQLKVQEAIRQHTSAGVFGQGEREAGSYENSMANLSNTWREFQAVIGTPIIGTVSDTLLVMAGHLKSVATWFDNLSQPTKDFVVTVGFVTAGLLILLGTLAPIVIGFSMFAGAVGVGAAALLGWIAVVAAVVIGVVALGVVIYKNWDEIWAKTKEIWGSITKFLSDTWKSISDGVSKFVSTIGKFFSDTWKSISSGVTGFLSSIEKWFSKSWDTVKTTTTKVFSAITDWIITWGKKLYTDMGIDKVVKLVVDSWNFLKDTTTILFDMVYAIIRAIFLKIMEYVNPVVTSIMEAVSAAWNKIKDVSTTVFGAVKTFLTTVWAAIKTAVTLAVAAILESVSAKWNSIKETTSAIFNSIKSTLSGIWDSIKSKVTTTSSDVESTVKDKFEAAKEAMLKPIEAGKKKIRELLDDIKGFFSNLVLQLPMPKLPHFSVSKGTTSFLGQEIPVPKFDVSWYKTGGIFTGASVVGIGEAGDEAVVPLSNKSKMKPFASAIASMIGADGVPSKKGGGDIVQNITINSPDYLSPSDIARKIEQNSRRLGREWG